MNANPLILNDSSLHRVESIERYLRSNDRTEDSQRFTFQMDSSLLYLTPEELASMNLEIDLNDNVFTTMENLPWPLTLEGKFDSRPSDASVFCLAAFVFYI